MAKTKGYVEHVALHVNDMQWHLRYFSEVLGMEPFRVQEKDGAVQQVWLHGGIQLTAKRDFVQSGPEGQGIAHFGMMVEDVRAAVDESLARGLRSVEGKVDWVRLPDGAMIELKQGKGTSVADALAIQPR